MSVVPRFWVIRLCNFYVEKYWHAFGVPEALVSSQQMPLCHLSMKWCRTAGVLHGTILSRQRATLAFDLFSYLNPHFNASHHVSTYCIGCVMSNLYVCFRATEPYLISFSVTHNIHFIGSKYTLIFIIVNNHKTQHHSSSNFQYKLIAWIRCCFYIIQVSLQKSTLGVHRKRVLEFRKIIFKLESNCGTFTFQNSFKIVYRSR